MPSRSDCALFFAFQFLTLLLSPADVSGSNKEAATTKTKQPSNNNEENNKTCSEIEDEILLSYNGRPIKKSTQNMVNIEARPLEAFYFDEDSSQTGLILIIISFKFL